MYRSSLTGPPRRSHYPLPAAGEEAEETAGADTIDVSAGTCVLTQQLDVTTRAALVGEGADESIFVGAGSTSLITVASISMFSVSDCTFTRFSGNGTSALPDNGNGNVRLSRCAVRGNTSGAIDGGALGSGTVTVDACLFSGDSPGNHGGVL